MCAIWEWFHSHEWVAIWLEGIALVLIFIWDRKDARGTHEEMMQQIGVARDQAEAARLTAQSVVNAERAWILVGLFWSTYAKVFTGTSRQAGEFHEATRLHLNIKLKNEGRTPGWIDEVRARVAVIPETGPVGNATVISSEQEYNLPGFSGLPVGAGTEHEQSAELTYNAVLAEAQRFRVALTVRYRDIFERNREAVVAFSINSRNEIERPEPGRHT